MLHLLIWYLGIYIMTGIGVKIELLCSVCFHKSLLQESHLLGVAGERIHSAMQRYHLHWGCWEHVLTTF